MCILTYILTLFLLVVKKSCSAAMARAAVAFRREPSAFTWLRRGFTETVTAKGRLRPNLHRLDVTWQMSGAGVRCDFSNEKSWGKN